MPKEQPILYSVPRTHMWFAIVSLILLASLVWTVFEDYSREWKTWQRKFIQLKVEKTQQELALASEKVDAVKLEELKTGYASAQADFKQRRKDYRVLEKEIGKLDTDIVKARTRAQDLKQYRDSHKYFLEEYRAHEDPRAGEYQKKLAAVEPKLKEAQLRLEELESRREGREEERQQFVGQMKALEKQREALLLEKKRVEKKLEAIKPTLATEILNAPMVDFIAPSLRIQQVVLEDLYDDYHFTKVQKVDRCTTCHLGIDQKGFEDAPQPFRTHPRLDLFLAPSSPHPLEKVGCTVCHSGSGHSVSFVESAHTPRDEAQRKAWEKKYRWQRMEKWEATMLPLQHTEASCVKCHRNVVEVPQAEKLNRGRRLAETYGCFGCHKIEGFENRWKVGPSLDHVASKLDRGWIVRWLQDPKAFRPSTNMPQIFHLANTSGPEEREVNDVAIEGIVSYLMKNSGTVSLDGPPVTGNPEHGEKLVKEVGCLGCHAAAGVRASDFAPELSGLGSKVKPEWLYTWLKDPKHYSKDTRMPNLRLTDQEAQDIASFLLTERNEEFDQQPIPQIKPAVLDELVLKNLQKTLRRVQAEGELAQMTEEAKLEFVGKESIAFQGCFACHSIKGFEDAKPIGTELSDHGRKDVHQLDFGLVHIDHTREAWFYQKLKEPRIFDQGKVKDYYEKLRMPHFNFTDEEAQALTTFLLSLNREHIPLEMQKALNLKETEIETGRLLTAKFNCQGCHTLDGKTGAVRSVIEDAGNAPPVLDGEGAKVQEKWLDAFLRNPSTIRPWLTYRMPTFGFEASEAQQLVQYFANLAGQEVSYKGLELPEATTDELATGKLLFDKFQCIKCHQVSQTSAQLGASFLAPDLTLTKERLKVGWVVEWLRDPQAVQPGTMMPTFFPEGQTPLPDVLGGDAQKQIEVIRDYLFRYAPEPSKEAKST